MPRRYVTRNGDRFDTISYLMYGTPFFAKRIIEANPSVPVVAYLSGGITLLIPDIAPREPRVKVLPPWKND